LAFLTWEQDYAALSQYNFFSWSCPDFNGNNYFLNQFKGQLLEINPVLVLIPLLSL
jgi:hypothetical protein